MPPTSPAIEDYLKTVYAHTEWQPDPITPKVLADRLGVAPSSVTEMVKKMAASGLVSHVPYGAVRLTDAGLARALAVVRRHRLIETWLVQRDGLRLGRGARRGRGARARDLRPAARGDRRAARPPGARPARRPIPAADGSLASEPWVLLGDASSGTPAPSSASATATRRAPPAARARHRPGHGRHRDGCRHPTPSPSRRRAPHGGCPSRPRTRSGWRLSLNPPDIRRVTCAPLGLTHGTTRRGRVLADRHGRRARAREPRPARRRGAAAAVADEGTPVPRAHEQLDLHRRATCAARLRASGLDVPEERIWTSALATADFLQVADARRHRRSSSARRASSRPCTRPASS